MLGELSVCHWCPATRIEGQQQLAGNYFQLEFLMSVVKHFIGGDWFITQISKATTVAATGGAAASV